MENVFRLKAMTIMGCLSKVDGAEFSYRTEQGYDPILEIYHKKELHVFTPTRKSFTEMDDYLEELQKESPSGARTPDEEQSKIIKDIIS